MQKLVIDAEKKGLGINFKELFQYKDLFWILAYRDIRIRYAQTFLGFSWAFIQPLSTLIIFALVFSKVAKINTGTVPYPLFALSGMVIWTYFAFVLSQAGNSIIGAQNMIQKVYFPRLIIPISKAVVGLMDFSIAFIFLVVMMIWFRFMPSIQVFFLPLFLLITFIASLGVGIWLSALTIRYRDFQYIVPYLVQFGMYATPVGYPANLITENPDIADWIKYAYFLNPMAGLIEGFRWSLIGSAQPMSSYIYISIIVAILLFLSSIFYFKRVEKVMADIV